jgi:hypothetical protein
MDVDVWHSWLRNFQVISNGNVEVKTTTDLESFEQENGFLLPKSYKNFCTVFGTCSFFQDRRVYCPNFALSEELMYPLKQEFNDALEFGNLSDYVSPNMISVIERILMRSGFMFSDDIGAKIYLFDTETYQREDESCDIWSASGEGELDSFSFLGRSFDNFFLDFCVELDDESLSVAEAFASLSQEKQFLRRFNSSQLMSL